MAKEIIKKPSPKAVDVGFNFSDVYESQYEIINFDRVIEQKKTESERILSLVADALKGKHFLEALKKNDVEYVVDMSDELKNAIENGDIKLDFSKAGEVFAQLRINGKYGKKLPIKRVLKAHNLDPVDVSNALQMKALDAKLDNIVSMLGTIGDDVEAIQQGQQNDRIALFFSGMNLYLEARDVQDSDMRKALIAQAMKSISDSNTQVLQQLQSEIQYLLMKQYAKKKGNSFQDMQEHIANINKSYEVVYRSYMLKAAIYLDQGELPAMITALNEYGHFIEKVIVPISPRLNELDANNTAIQDGIWEQRAAMLSSVNELKQQIESNNSFVIGIESPKKQSLKLDGDSTLETKPKIKEVIYAG